MGLPLFPRGGAAPFEQALVTHVALLALCSVARATCSLLRSGRSITTHRTISLVVCVWLVVCHVVHADRGAEWKCSLRCICVSVGDAFLRQIGPLQQQQQHHQHCRSLFWCAKPSPGMGPAASDRARPRSVRDSPCRHGRVAAHAPPCGRRAAGVTGSHR